MKIADLPLVRIPQRENLDPEYDGRVAGLFTRSSGEVLLAVLTPEGYVVLEDIRDVVMLDDVGFQDLDKLVYGMRLSCGDTECSLVRLYMTENGHHCHLAAVFLSGREIHSEYACNLTFKDADK